MPLRESASKLSFLGFGAILTVVLIVGVGMGVSAAVNAYSRAEQHYAAENQVALTHIAISRARQHPLITGAQIEATVAVAHKRVAETVAITRARSEISRTLTVHYLQQPAR
jgi:hypothetical protein